MSAEVGLGFFSFTEVTDPSEHPAYNEWHQLDHLPQQYEIPGIVFGQRWASPPPCTNSRPFEGDLLQRVHYVTLYLMSSPVDATLDRFVELAGSLRSKGRFFEHRKARLSGPFEVCGTAVAERALVSADVVPFRPNRGVYVIVEDLESSGRTGGRTGDRTGDRTGEPSGERTGERIGETERWRDRAERLVGHRAVAGTWTFDSSRMRQRPRWQPGRRRVTVCYLDQPPMAVAAELGDLVRELWSDADEPELAGPFETITPWEWDWDWDSGSA
ncbi:MAG: hypothetical protein ACRDV4_12645 [Acidimicrobiales bacterium]